MCSSGRGGKAEDLVIHYSFVMKSHRVPAWENHLSSFTLIFLSNHNSKQRFSPWLCGLKGVRKRGSEGDVNIQVRKPEVIASSLPSHTHSGGPSHPAVISERVSGHSPVMTVYFCLWSQLPTESEVQKHTQDFICKYVSGWHDSAIYSWKVPISVPLLSPFSPGHSPLWSLPTTPLSPHLAGHIHKLVHTRPSPGKYSLVPDAQGNFLWASVGFRTACSHLFMHW